MKHDNAVSKKRLFSPETNPPNSTRGIGAGENSTNEYRSLVSESSITRIMQWRCLKMEMICRHRGRHGIWIEKVSDSAIIHRTLGWVCGCGSWTFGDDEYHVPVFFQKYKRGFNKEVSDR